VHFRFHGFVFTAARVTTSFGVPFSARLALHIGLARDRQALRILKEFRKPLSYFRPLKFDKPTQINVQHEPVAAHTVPAEFLGF
jgi:hypothetical protein